MPKEHKQITITRSYFYKYIPELSHSYCPACDDVIMTSMYVDKHLKTRKHKLHVERLNNFINTNMNNFVKEDIKLLTEVLQRYPIFCTGIIPRV